MDRFENKGLASLFLFEPSPDSVSPLPFPAFPLVWFGWRSSEVFRACLFLCPCDGRRRSISLTGFPVNVSPLKGFALSSHLFPFLVFFHIVLGSRTIYFFPSESFFFPVEITGAAFFLEQHQPVILGCFSSMVISSLLLLFFFTILTAGKPPPPRNDFARRFSPEVSFLFFFFFSGYVGQMNNLTFGLLPQNCGIPPCLNQLREFLFEDLFFPSFPAPFCGPELRFDLPFQGKRMWPLLTKEFLFSPFFFFPPSFLQIF